MLRYCKVRTAGEAEASHLIMRSWGNSPQDLHGTTKPHQHPALNVLQKKVQKHVFGSVATHLIVLSIHGKVSAMGSGVLVGSRQILLHSLCGVCKHMKSIMTRV